MNENLNENWRLLDTGRRSAAENMALDRTILECRAKNIVPNTLRILRFSPPAVLVGYHQDVHQEVRLEYVEKQGIHVNRRLTGGGAIYFDETSLGWEIIASKSSVHYKRIEDLYEKMCRGIVEALRLLGVKASYRPKNDVEVNGKKISGTGGTEHGDAFLFQGTLLIDFDVETMIKTLKIPIVKLKDKEIESARQRVTCLKSILKQVPPEREIKEAIKKGFEKTLKIRLIESGLTELEEKMLKEKVKYFSSPKWIYQDRTPRKEACLVNSIDKRPGGLIKVSLAIDRETKIIKNILITGDFLITPTRTIYDLEAHLKFTPTDKIEEKVKKFFKEKKVQMLKLTPKDFIDPIKEAVEKASYEKLGLTINEIQHINPVTRNAKKVLEGQCEYLLLPYCSKKTSCKYRTKEGCVKCGECTIGEAYSLAEKYGLKPITIQSFEHLMQTLRKIKGKGATGYLGCCCEAFYQKHRDDLEKTGLPAILIDIDSKTCYELGKEKEAYKGKFKVQTKLKIPILKKTLQIISKNK